MKKIAKLKVKTGLTAVLLTVLLPFSAFAQAGDTTPAKELDPQDMLLRRCRDDILGVRFLCDPDWGLQTEDDALLIIISSDPAVTMTVAQIQTPIQYVEQLTDAQFRELGLYGTSFRKEVTKFGQHSAVMVKAFAKDTPDMRLLDYYTVYKGKLYSVLFSVNPKDKWEDYKFLIKRIGDSFEFLDTEGNSQEARNN